MAKTSDSNMPVQTLRHRSIKAAIWENQTAKGIFYTVTVTRSYKQEEVWHESHSFNHDELLVVAKLMYDAHSAISLLIANAKAATAPRLPLGRRKTQA